MQLNVAILGCGRVAGHHARSILKLPEYNLVAVCDLAEDRATQLAKVSGVRQYQSYHSMLKEHPEIDLVSIITPSGMHFEHGLDIVETYKKNILVEKPMVMTLSQGSLLKQAATKAGVQVFPVFQYRFNKSVQRLRQAVQGGELGQLVLATIRTRWCRPQSYYDRDPWRGTWGMDGGACTNQGIHHLDLLRYLAGEVSRVNSTTGTFGAKIEVEDTVVATAEFVSGAKGVIEITTAARPNDFESSISFVGTKGLAMVGGWATNALVTFSPDPTQEKEHTEEFPDVYGFGHTDIYKGAFNSLRGLGHPAVEYADAMGTLGLLHSIYVSDEKRQWVDVELAQESKRLGTPNEKVANLYRTKRT